MSKNQLFTFFLLVLATFYACKSETKNDPNTFGAGVSKQDNPAAFSEVVSQLDEPGRL
jgi:hypothetical protein